MVQTDVAVRPDADMAESLLGGASSESSGRVKVADKATAEGLGVLNDLRNNPTGTTKGTGTGLGFRV